MAKPSSGRFSFLYVLPGIVLLAGIGYGVFLAFRGILGLESQVQAALFTFLGAFAIWLIRATYESRREERRRGYEHRRDVYLKLLSTFQSIFALGRTEGATPTDDMVEGLREASGKLYLEASDDVFRAFRKILSYAQEGAAADPEEKQDFGLRMVHGLGCFMLAMRKDVGFRRTTLDEHDYLRQLLNDYDDHKDHFNQLQC